MPATPIGLWRQLARGLRALTHRSAVDRDLADEVRHYLDQATAAHIARGLPPHEARRAARLEVGNATSVEEQVRGYGWENVVEALAADVKYGVRRLRAAPGFTVIAVITLAIGIGGTTAIVSAVNPILLEPLPYPEADRIAMIQEVARDGSRNQGTFAMYRALATRARTIGPIAVLRSWQPTATGPEQPERFDGQRVSADYFRVLGVSPVLGRDFEAADDRLNGPKVVILGDALWRRRFGGDRAIVGRTITLDDDPWVVIGVMPPGFENVLDPAARLWRPLQYDMSLPQAWGHHLRTIARLAPGVSGDEARRELDAIAQSVVKEKPEMYDESTRLLLPSMQDDVTRSVRPVLLTILGAVSLVLVIACVNVTNLILARGVQRRGEFALRAALGAGRGRLARQLLTESLLLSAAGGVVGMAVAMLGVRALVALGPPGLPRLGAIRVDGAAFAIGLAITAIVGLALGLLPALRAARIHPHRDIQHASRNAAGTHGRTRGALVVTEVALALVLLVISGLLLRSLDRLFAVDVGFDSSRLLTMQVQTAGRRLSDDESVKRFFDEALDAVGRVPGVTAAALTSQLPLSGDLDEYGVHLEATGTVPARTVPGFRYGVSPGYIETMRIPLVRGRSFEERDREGAPLVALITAELAKRGFPGMDPIGQRLRVGPTDGAPYTIVGIVGDVKQASLAVSRSEGVYTTASQWRFADASMSLVVRANGDPAALAPAVREAVWSVDKDQPVVRIAMMDDLVAQSAAERRFALILFEAFALAALVLAAAGIYGVISSSVAERTREIGVRSALGASRANILALVFRQGLRLTGFGVAIGVAGAFVASRAVAAMLFGISRLDTVTYVGVVLLLGVVAVIACWVPAWRAARLDPARTLRAS